MSTIIRISQIQPEHPKEAQEFSQRYGEFRSSPNTRSRSEYIITTEIEGKEEITKVAASFTISMEKERPQGTSVGTHLDLALASAEHPETKYHLREALQKLEIMEGTNPQTLDDCRDDRETRYHQ